MIADILKVLLGLGGVGGAMARYSRRISDLAGIGCVVRQVRKFAVFLIRYRAERTSRELQNHAEQLRNDEQSLRNQHSRLLYTKNLLALAEKYKCDPAALENLTDLITNKQEHFSISGSSYRTQSPQVVRVVLAVSSPTKRPPSK